MISGACYSMMVYCDFHQALEGRRYRPNPGEVTGRNHGQCMKELREAGWVMGREFHKCPDCVAERRTEIVGEMR